VNRTPIFNCVRDLLGRGFSPAEVVLLDKAIDEAEGIAPNPTALADASKFFDAIRPTLGPFVQSQVEGLQTLLQAFGAARWPLAYTAYGLATAWHETAAQMQPVREAYWLSEAWRKANLHYYPWYGRGYVQLTWQHNYEHADEELELGGSLIANPDRALEHEIASKVMVRGMEEGWFTSKKLGDYLPLSGEAGFDAFKGARYIVNRQDKAELIAKEAQTFQAGLLKGGWA